MNDVASQIITRRALCEGVTAILIGFGIKSRTDELEPGESKPEHALVGYLTVGTITMTAITRMWKPGTAERCQRCPTCSVHHNVCTILVGRRIPKSQAREHRSSMEGWQGVMPGTNPVSDAKGGIL